MIALDKSLEHWQASVYSAHLQFGDDFVDNESDTDEEGLLLGRLPSLGEEGEEAIDEQQQYQKQLSEAESVDPHTAGGGGSLVSAALGIIKGMVGPGKSAFVLFYVLNSCVQYQVSAVWLVI